MPDVAARESSSAAQVPAEAFQALATLQQLTLEAGLSESRAQLGFRILNRTIAYCQYDRAALWLPAGRGWKLLGVSGGVDVNQQAPLVAEWTRALRATGDLQAPMIIEPDARPALPPEWHALGRRTNGFSLAWLPIVVSGRPVAALWLERWNGSRFTRHDLTRLEPLILAYGVAWRSVTRPRGRLARLLGSRKWITACAASLAILTALVLVPVPLRIVAPCEVVPDQPLVIAAPLAGVIDEVLVLPGRQVAAGELLAVYDKRVALEELKVAEQQVLIIDSDLQRARVQAFQDADARAQIALLENRLAQEQTRLRLARERAARLQIRAPQAGTLMFDDPHTWRGRPVQVGERIMMIVDPQRTKLRIWLPESDKIEFGRERPVHVVLDCAPQASRRATLRFLANHYELNRDGQPCFRAEADWADAAATARMGLQGTAVLYGDDVPLGCWLLRRPLAAVRRTLGV